MSTTGGIRVSTRHTSIMHEECLETRRTASRSLSNLSLALFALYVMLESPMNITVEDVAPCKKRLKIEVPANRVKEAYEKVANDFQKEARIPGSPPRHPPPP